MDSDSLLAQFAVTRIDRVICHLDDKFRIVVRLSYLLLERDLGTIENMLSCRGGWREPVDGSRGDMNPILFGGEDATCDRRCFNEYRG